MVLDRLATAGSAHAPHLIDVEVASALRRLARSEGDNPRWTAALAGLADLPVRRWEHTPLLPLIWSWRHSVSAYDAAYLALAQTLDAPLVTLDQGLAANARGVVAIERLEV